jgi:hypothetical protein
MLEHPMERRLATGTVALLLRRSAIGTVAILLAAHFHRRGRPMVTVTHTAGVNPAYQAPFPLLPHV